MFLEMNFKSNKLKKQTQAYVIIPDSARTDGAPLKVLWLFHGLSDNHTSWMRYTSIERYAELYRVAVIMPNVDRSWYTDTTYEANYFSFISEELPELCFKTFSQLSRKREDNIAAGLSMGGYGAMKLALSCPESYGACISLSGALDMQRTESAYNLKEWQSIFDADMENSSALLGTKHDLFAISANLKKSGGKFPKIYMWCGNDDFLIQASCLFDKHLTDLGVSHKFETSEGIHTWKWWDLHIQSGLEWILNG